MRALLLVGMLGACAHVTKQAWPESEASGSVTEVQAPAVEEPATREPPPAVRSEACVWPVEPVSMDLMRADVRAVLQALADRGRMNVVLADDVEGRVTVRLDEVPLGEALVTIAHAAGLALETDRCVTTVATPASAPSR